MKIALIIILCLIIFILIHVLIGQLDDLCEYEKKINKAIEYLTSYDSIQDFYFGEKPEYNKELDEKTINEMIRRYLIVHHKLLDILEGEDNG